MEKCAGTSTFYTTNRQPLMVTMDVNRLYNDIDHTEGADVCYIAMEKRKNKYALSRIIRNLILFILKNNVFKSASCVYKQIMGIAMGTPMAPYYANLFITQVETNMLNDYQADNGLRLIFWYTDNVFFLWAFGEQSVTERFIRKYSESKNMKSVLNYDVHYSTEEVTFLHCKVKISKRGIETDFLRKLPMHICIFWLRHAIQNTHNQWYTQGTIC